jgi:hypothetical protein
MNDSNRPYGLFLLGFAFGLPIALLSVYAIFRLAVPPETAVKTLSTLELDQRLLSSIPEAWTERSITSVERIKEKRLFWANQPNQSGGVGLRLLETPELFGSVYPGYPAAMARDTSLWNGYFRRAFGTEIFSEAMKDSAPSGVAVVISSVGCIDIYERYGADLVIFGASEAYRGIIPSVLSKLVTAPGARASRVLVCASPTPDLVRMTAEAMARNSREGKTAWAIWGVSPWSFRPRDPDVQAHWRSRVEEYLTASFTPIHAWLRFRLLLSQLATWDSVFEPSLQRYLDTTQNRSEEGGVPLEIPEARRGDSAYIGSAVSRRHWSFPYLKHVAAEECGFSEGRRELDGTLDALLGLSDRVLLFVPPTTPLQASETPKCFQESARAIVASKAASRVVTKVGDWRVYGLDFADYVDSRGRIDVNHVNYAGAEKITAKLAREILGAGSEARR